MNQTEFDKVVEETMSNLTKLLVVKGGEYAGTEDRLSNFKRGAALTGAHPLQVLFIYMSKHYDGIASFIRGEAAGRPLTLSEPIDGRIDDLINYGILLKALIRESERERERFDSEGASLARRPPSESGGYWPLPR